MKTIVTVFTLFVSVSAFSQLERGTITMGALGSGGLATDFEGYRSMTLSLSPTIGFFPAKNLMIGGHFSGNYYSERLAGNVNRSYASSTGVLSRYYFNLGQTKDFIGGSRKPLAIYPEFGVSYGSLNPLQGSGLNTHVGLGASLFVTKRLAFEMALKYNLTGPNTTPRAGRFSIPVGLTFYFGR